MEEEWRDIKGYEGLYQVSNLGRIKSLPKFHRTNKNYSSMINNVPSSLLNTNSSFKSVKPNIIIKTVDNCFNILNVEGSNPYLASMFNLSVTAYINTTIKSVNNTLVLISNFISKTGIISNEKTPVNSSNKIVKEPAFFILRLDDLNF